MAKRASATQPKPRSTGARPAPRSRSCVHFILLFVACALMVNAIVGDKGLVAMMRAKRERDELTAKIESVREENERLRKERDRLNEDPAALEEIARRELGLVRPGEKLFIIKDLPAPPAAPKK